MDSQGLTAPTKNTSASLRSPRGSTSTASSSVRSPRSLAGSVVRGQNTDKLCALINLLSSMVVFTQQGQVNERLLDFLEPVVKLSDLISKPSGATLAEEHASGLFSEHLLCVMQDYVKLELTANSAYEPQTPIQMLENCFKPASSIAVRRCKLQETLKSIFSQRDCLALNCAGQSAGNANLEPESAEAIQSFVLKKVKAKCIKSKKLSGSMFLALALNYCQVLSVNGFSSHRASEDYPLSSIPNAIEEIALEETY